jgi:hypothetical protein
MPQDFVNLLGLDQFQKNLRTYLLLLGNQSFSWRVVPHSSKFHVDAPYQMSGAHDKKLLVVSLKTIEE